MIKTHIRIEDGKVRLIEEKEKKAVSFDRFMETLCNSSPFNSGILPQGTRFFIKDENRLIYVVEIMPMIKTLILFNHPFEIPLPYVYFVVQISDKGWVTSKPYWFMASSRIESTKSQLCQSWWPNAESSGEVCTGRATFKTPKDALPSANVEAFIITLLDSPFNFDLANGYQPRVLKSIKTLTPECPYWSQEKFHAAFENKFEEKTKMEFIGKRLNYFVPDGERPQYSSQDGDAIAFWAGMEALGKDFKNKIYAIPKLYADLSFPKSCNLQQLFQNHFGIKI